MTGGRTARHALAFFSYRRDVGRRRFEPAYGFRGTSARGRKLSSPRREEVKANDGGRGDRSPLPYLCTFALDLGSVVLSTVTEMLFAHSMSWIDFEPTLFSHQRQVFPDTRAAVVEEHVVVGTEAEDVVRCVRPVVRCSERLNVRGLRVGSGEAL